jgi:hypothetical protein
MVSRVLGLRTFPNGDAHFADKRGRLWGSEGHLAGL